MKQKIILSLCGVFVFAMASAQDADSLYSMSVEDLLNISVTVSTKSETDLDQAPGTVRVITRKQIEDMNARSLKDVLNIFVPGMDVIPTTYKYGDRVETAYARGVLSDFSQQILYLLNGKTKFNESTFGQPFQQGEITLENIERIEISATPIPLQGASAITIINLITREGTMNGFEANATTGFSDKVSTDGIQRKRISIIGGKEIGKWHLGLSAQVFDDEGQAHTNAAGAAGYGGSLSTLRDGTKFSGVLGLNLKSNDGIVEWMTYLKKSSYDAYLSGLVPSQSGGLYTYDVQTLHNSLKINAGKGFEVSAGLMTSNFVNFIDFLGAPYGSDDKNYDVFVEGNYTKKIGSHSLLFGAKAEREGQRDATAYLWDGVSKFEESKDPSLILAPSDSRNIYSAFVEDQISLGKKFSVNAGLRFDHFENFADSKLSRFNPRLALTYNVSQSFIVKALYVTAFRPPTNYELQGVALVPLTGNANINVEHLSTYEMNLIYKKKNFKLQLTSYLQEYNDRILYIDTDPNDDAVVLQANNIGNTHTLGFEFAGNYYLNTNNYFFAGFSSFDSHDEVDGVEAHTPFLPTLYINGGVNLRKDKFGFNTSAYFRGDRHLPDGMPINTKYATGSIFNANVNLSYFPTEGSKIYLLVENVTDQKNYIPYATDGAFMPLRSRTYNIGMTIKF